MKVLDFGVAKLTAAQSYEVVTSTGAMIGTPGYMSPEQVLHGSEVDLRSDLWSLGVVAYHCMIGNIPFRGETLGALCVAISQGAYLPPSQMRAELPASVDAWMRRMLALRPNDRFQSARQAAETFRDALRGIAPVSAAEAGRAPPPGPLGAVRPSADRARTKLWQRPPEDDATRQTEMAPVTEPSDDDSDDAAMLSTVRAPVTRHGRGLVIGVAASSFVVGFILVVVLLGRWSQSSSAPLDPAPPATTSAALDEGASVPPAEPSSEPEGVWSAAQPTRPEPVTAPSTPAPTNTPHPHAPKPAASSPLPLPPPPPPTPLAPASPPPTAKDCGF